MSRFRKGSESSPSQSGDISLCSPNADSTVSHRNSAKQTSTPKTSTDLLDMLTFSPSPAQDLERFFMTLEAVDKVFDPRPVLIVHHLRLPNKICILIAPVTKFKNKSLASTNLTDSEKEYFIPISPNTEDILGRAPILTDPLWAKERAWQALHVLPVSMERIVPEDHITHHVSEDFKRLLLEMSRLRKKHQPTNLQSNANVFIMYLMIYSMG